MREILAKDPEVATRDYPPRRPMCHLAFSKHIKAVPEKEANMLAMAELLLAHGADVNDSYSFEPGGEHRLSALYGVIGHADNMPLANGSWSTAPTPTTTNRSITLLNLVIPIRPSVWIAATA